MNVCARKQSELAIGDHRFTGRDALVDNYAIVQSPAHPSHGRGRAGQVGVGQGELIVCAGEMIAEESAIESPKPPRSIRSNCFTSRPAAPLSH